MILKRAFELPEVIAALAPLQGLIPGAVDPDAAAALRRTRKLRRFDLAHRGRYCFADVPRDPSLQRFAEQLFQLPLLPARPRLFKLTRGDYSLMFDDAQARIERGVELTLDLSTEATGEGAIVYGDLVVPQQPGLLSAVLRVPGVYRYERYLPHGVGRAAVWRLRVAYPLAGR